MMAIVTTGPLERQRKAGDALKHVVMEERSDNIDTHLV